MSFFSPTLAALRWIHNRRSSLKNRNSMTSIFLVYATNSYEDGNIDGDTKAFHSMEGAEDYRAELEAADKVVQIAHAKNVLDNMDISINRSLYKGMTEEEIVNYAMHEWEIEEIPLG